MTNPHRPFGPAWAFLAALLVVSGCEQPPSSSTGPPGVTVAREHLYPYQFDDKHTLRGVELLQSYLAQEPNGRDARMAAWLLARTSSDMLVRALVLEVLGEPEAAHALLTTLGDLLNTTPTAKELARTIRTRLEVLVSDDMLANEARVSIELLDAIVGRDDRAFYGRTLSRVAASGLDAQTPARLLIAAEALTAFAGVGPLAPARRIEHFAARYPFPCPDGFVAFAQGDRSLSSCPFICDDARKRYDVAPLARRKQLLLDVCGPEHFGFVDVEDAGYLSPENFVVARVLTHMSLTLEALRAESTHPARALNFDLVKRLDAMLGELSVVARLPLLSPELNDLRLPQVDVSSEVPVDTRQAISITKSSLMVNLQAHLRVAKGQVYLPEVILRYRFPGRVAAVVQSPFASRTPAQERLLLEGLLTALDDLERDLPRVNERLGDLIPGAQATSTSTTHRMNLRQKSTLLLVDDAVDGDLLRLVLMTLHEQGNRPVSVVVWNAHSGQPAAVTFDTMRGPAPLQALRVHLGSQQWTITSHHEPTRASSPELSPEQGLVELYTEVAARRGDAPTYVSFDSNVGLTRLLTALALVSSPREVHSARSGSVGLDELLSAPPEDAGSASAREPAVVLLLTARSHPNVGERKLMQKDSPTRKRAPR